MIYWISCGLVSNYLIYIHVDHKGRNLNTVSLSSLIRVFHINNSCIKFLVHPLKQQHLLYKHIHCNVSVVLFENHTIIVRKLTWSHLHMICRDTLTYSLWTMPVQDWLMSCYCSLPGTTWQGSFDTSSASNRKTYNWTGVLLYIHFYCKCWYKYYVVINGLDNIKQSSWFHSVFHKSVILLSWFPDNMSQSKCYRYWPSRMIWTE